LSRRLVPPNRIGDGGSRCGEGGFVGGQSGRAGLKIKWRWRAGCAKMTMTLNWIVKRFNREAAVFFGQPAARSVKKTKTCDYDGKQISLEAPSACKILCQSGCHK
jgi:hypothetical protein